MTCVGTCGIVVRTCDMNLLFFVLCIALSLIVVYNGAQLISLNDSPHARYLYLKLRNRNFPSSKRDAAVSTGRYRRSICDSITSCGFFQYLGLEAVHLSSDIFHELRNPLYFSTFDEMFSRIANEREFSYSNIYKRRKFKIRQDPALVHRFEEYTFICLFRELLDPNKVLIPYYVSKQYNVDSTGKLYKPGRFVFGNIVESDFNYILFAEEPAKIYDETSFDIELHYLKTRRYIDPVHRRNIDPLCKLLSRNEDDPKNQHPRICAAISRSSAYIDKVRYPFADSTHTCSMKQVSFRTPNGTEEAAEVPFNEFMAMCNFSWIDDVESERFLYISRSYTSNAIFVYRNDPSREIYLENLIFNVDIVDELNSFDFIEY